MPLMTGGQGLAAFWAVRPARAHKVIAALAAIRSQVLDRKLLLHGHVRHARTRDDFGEHRRVRRTENGDFHRLPIAPDEDGHDLKHRTVTVACAAQRDDADQQRAAVTVRAVIPKGPRIVRVSPRSSSSSSVAPATRNQISNPTSATAPKHMNASTGASRVAISTRHVIHGAPTISVMSSFDSSCPSNVRHVRRTNRSPASIWSGLRLIALVLCYSSSTYARSPCTPPSRPKPLSLYPPKGLAASNLL